MKLDNFALSVTAKPGHGKTEFLLSAPRPLYTISMDPNTRFVMRQAKRDGRGTDITTKYIIPPALAFDDREDVQLEAQDKWEEFRNHLRPIVKGEIKVKTVGLDTATLLYNLGIISAFGKSDQIPVEVRRNMLGPINTRWQGIVDALVQRGVNVILLHRAKDMWIDAVVETQQGTKEERKRLTGNFQLEREGYNGTGFMVSTEIHLAFDPARNGTTKLSDRFGMQIVRCQQRPGLVDRKYWGTKTIDGKTIRKASFPYLASLLYPHTSVADWS